MDEILKLPLPRRPSLCKADLTDANLSGANLRGANLSRARFNGADLRGANLRKADLSRFYLSFPGPNLRGADLTDADLSGAYLRWANLSGANLLWAKLSGANLLWAKLSGANLREADLSGANLHEADLTSTFFEPVPQSLNSVVDIESAIGFDQLSFWNSPTALVVLRERFAKAGRRDLERQVTYSKLRSQQVKEWLEGPFWRRVEAGFSYVAFDLTSAYGLDYGRPLRILAPMILLFGVVYTIALRGRGHGALWRVWQPDRIREDQGQSDPERLSWEPVSVPGKSPRGFVFRLWRALGLGLFFSLLSAFQIGWRELNVGNWITRGFASCRAPSHS